MHVPETMVGSQKRCYWPELGSGKDGFLLPSLRSPPKNRLFPTPKTDFAFKKILGSNQSDRILIQCVKFLSYSITELGNCSCNTGNTGQGLRVSRLSGLFQVNGAFVAADIQSNRLARVMAT